MDEPDYLSVIEAIYAGVLSPNGFNHGLQAVKETFGIELACLLLWDRHSDLIRVVGAAGMLAEFQNDYESHFQFEDPVKKDFPAIRVADWWIDTQQIGLARMKSSAFHQEFLRTYEMTSFMASPIFRSSDMEVSLTLVRSRANPLFTRAAAAAFQPIVPHLRRAVLLREQMGELTSAANLTQGLLDHLPFGVAVIDDRLRVLTLNNPGRRHLAALGPPSRWQRRMPGSAHALEPMIRQACKHTSPSPVQASTIRLPGRGDSKLLVLPLPAVRLFSLGWQQPAALVIFIDTRPSTRLLPRILRDLYGLNPSEARLALRLADGSKLQTVSAELCITRETARSTLKVIFSKTGVRSQTQLVRLLAVLTTIDAPQPAL